MSSFQILEVFFAKIQKVYGRLRGLLNLQNCAEKIRQKIVQKIGWILICDHTIIKRLFCAKSWDELMNFID